MQIKELTTEKKIGFVACARFITLYMYYVLIHVLIAEAYCSAILHGAYQTAARIRLV